MTKTFTIEIKEGDAMIRLGVDQKVQLIFAEDGNTIVREMAWPDHYVYKTAVQFALMIDSFFKNGEGLDSIIMNSPTGNIAQELVGKDLLTIELTTAGEIHDEDFHMEVDVDSHKDPVEFIPDNVIDATDKFNKKEKNDEDE